MTDLVLKSVLTWLARTAGCRLFVHTALSDKVIPASCSAMTMGVYIFWMGIHILLHTYYIYPHPSGITPSSLRENPRFGCPTRSSDKTGLRPRTKPFPTTGSTLDKTCTFGTLTTKGSLLLSSGNPPTKGTQASLRENGGHLRGCGLTHGGCG